MIKINPTVGKAALLVVLSWFSSDRVFSQISVGAKAGVNINQFNQPGSIFGFNGGAFARYKVLDFLNARVELLYMQQGGGRHDYTRTINNDGPVTSISYTHRYVRLNNVEIPLLVELSHPKFASEIFTPRLLVGISYGYNIIAREYSDRIYRYRNSGIPQLTFSDRGENVRSDYAMHQWGIVGGFALDFAVGDETLTAEVRYRRGLNELNLNNFIIIDQISPQQHGNLFTSTLSINIGLTLFNF